MFYFFFSSRRRHTRYIGDWSSDVCSSDLFLAVLLRTFFTDVLLDLQLVQLANDPGAEDERKKKRRQARVSCAHRDVAKNVQRAEVTAQHFKEQVIEHLSDAPPAPGWWLAFAAPGARPQCVPSSRRANL